MTEVTRFSWLAYSAVDNGGFCLNCLLFGTEGVHNASRLQRLVSSPLLPSTSSSKKLTDHAMKSKDDAFNPGNFIMFLIHGAYCGNIMDLIFKDCPSNQTYRSKTETKFWKSVARW